MKKDLFVLLKLVFLLSSLVWNSPVHAVGGGQKKVMPVLVSDEEAEKKHEEAFGSKASSRKVSSLADLARASMNERENDEQSALFQMPNEILALIASHTNVETLRSMACASRRLRSVVNTDQVKKSVEPFPGFYEFDAQFVTIPAGFLPNDRKEIASFETGKYPAVTEKLWQKIMGSLPNGYQPKGPNYPITHVNWEDEDGSPAEVQEFLAKLNEKTAHLGCTYDLPTDRQLHYLIRGDVTGTNTAKFMMAKDQDGSPIDVNDNNRDDYIWHYGNSDTGSGRQVQPMGTKKVNAFGIERPSVWMMSKDIYDSTHPDWDRSMRGGSWDVIAYGAESRIRHGAFAGRRFDLIGLMGFPLVRTCH
jgi:hypothetical protein